MTVKVDEKELGERKKSGEESGFDDDGYGLFLMQDMLQSPSSGDLVYFGVVVDDGDEEEDEKEESGGGRNASIGC